MSLLSGLVTQILHLALMGVAAPTVIGVLRWLRARLVGRGGAPLLQPWLDLARLLRKQPVLSENASDVTSAAPAVGAVATVIAACLVPSFALGMISAPLADLLLVFGLLGLSRMALALSAADVGSDIGTLAVSRMMLLACLAGPALLLVLAAFAVSAGSLNLDLIATMRVGAGGVLLPGVACGAMLLLALIDMHPNAALSHDLSGSDLALFELSEAVRLLVWGDLIGVLVVPLGMAPAGAGPLAWVAGLGVWLARTLCLVAALAMAQTLIARIRLAQAARLLGAAMLLGLLAMLVALTATGSA